MLEVNGSTDETATEIRMLVERLVQVARSEAFLVLVLSKPSPNAKVRKREIVYVRLASFDDAEPVLRFPDGRMIVRCKTESGERIDLFIGPERPEQDQKPVTVAREF